MANGLQKQLLCMFRPLLLLRLVAAELQRVGNLCQTFDRTKVIKHASDFDAKNGFELLSGDEFAQSAF